MATTKALKKENEELRLEIGELQKKIDKMPEDISRRNDSHAVSMVEKETSVEFFSAKYDDLVVFKTNTITELKKIKSEVNDISKKCDKIANPLNCLKSI